MPGDAPAPMLAPRPSRDRALSALVLSLGFWACIAAAGVLFAGVSLAGRIVENARLEREFAERQSELLTLQQEVTHLEHVARGLEEDAAFARTIARHELQQAPAALRALEIEGRLQHDPRRAPPDPVDVPFAEPWYLPILESLATSPARRLRWSLAAAGLLLIGFVFLHEHAGSRAAWRVLAIPLRGLAFRYLASPQAVAARDDASTSV